MKKKGLPVSVSISGYQKKGSGTGLFCLSNGEEATVEVPFTMVGDRVVVEPLKKRGGHYIGTVQALEVAAKGRVLPKCLHFGVCGGCQWQHIPYDEQLKIKQTTVREAFSSLINSTVRERAIIPCDRNWRYRNKMEFTFSQDSKGEQFLGLIMSQGRGRVVNLTECHLVNEWQEEALDAVRLWWKEVGVRAYHHHTDKGALRTLTLRESFSSGDRMVILTVSGNADFALNKQQIESFTAAVSSRVKPEDPKSQLSIVLRIQQIAKGAPTQFYEMILFGPDHLRECLEVEEAAGKKSVALDFHVSPMSFFQPNPKQAEKLYSLAVQLAKIRGESIVYDLFCGTGTLAICASIRAKLVVGIELCHEAVLDARSNASLNQRDNVTILSGAVRKLLPEILESHTYPMPDIIFIDPPRCGVGEEALFAIEQLKPKRIVYVSCNPATQAVDVEKLVQFGYSIETIQPVDQFAHTPHIENIVTLTL